MWDAEKYWSDTLGFLETFDQREILRHLSYVCLSERKELRTSNFAKSFYYLQVGRYWEWAISVHRIWYLPYKQNRYTGILGTWKIRFASNFITRLVYQLLMTQPKIILIRPQGPVPPIVVKSVYWGWAHGTSDSHQIWYLGLYTNSKEQYQKLSSSGTYHISQIGILLSWANGTSDSHRIWYLGLFANST